MAAGKILLRVVWKIAVKLHSVSGDLCEWCSEYYGDNYWYEEVQKQTGKLLWRAEI